jgi:Raf kinase inhibitor-like YbhB/YbcL family protein
VRDMRKGTLFSVFICAILVLGAGCSRKDVVSLNEERAIPLQPVVQKKEGGLQLQSPAFADGGTMPEMFTCRGHDFSPPLTISGASVETMSFVLIMEDRDKPAGSFVHWILYNIPPDTTFIAEGDVPPGSLGQGSDGKMSYKGPCPPKGEMHQYRFELLAMDATLALPEGLTKSELIDKLENHVLERDELTVSFVY